MKPLPTDLLKALDDAMVQDLGVSNDVSLRLLKNSPRQEILAAKTRLLGRCAQALWVQPNKKKNFRLYLSYNETIANESHLEIQIEAAGILTEPHPELSSIIEDVAKALWEEPSAILKTLEVDLSWGNEKCKTRGVLRDFLKQRILAELASPRAPGQRKP